MAVLTQEDLDAAIAAHALWIADHGTGTQADFTGDDLRGLDATGADLTGAIMGTALLRGCVFDDAIMPAVDFSAADFVTGAGGTLSMQRADLTGADFTGVSLAYWNIDGARFLNAVMDGATLSHVSAIATNFNGASLTSANLGTYSDFTRATFYGADLTGAAGMIGTDFTSASLNGAVLIGADFTWADLSGVGMKHCDIDHTTIFDRATLTLARYELELMLPALGHGKRTFTTNVGDLTGANSNAAQPIFQAGNDTFATGADISYLVDLFFTVTNGATSCTKSLVFGGTATFTSMRLDIVAQECADNALATVSAAALKTQAAASPILPAGTATAWCCRARGIIRVNAAGSIIPQFQFSADPTGTVLVKGDSYMVLTPIGSKTAAYRGGWA